MADAIKEITDDNFDSDVIKCEQPVLVDFWAPWCGPCKAIGPTVAELAGAYGEQVGFFKCNVDENQGTPSAFGIRAIPTLILFKDGKVFDQITGMVSKPKIEEMLQNALSGAEAAQPFLVQS